MMKRSVCALALIAGMMAPAEAGWFDWFRAEPASYAKTRYPIVLVHGLFGFDKKLGVDYFYQVPADLQAAGAEVYVVSVDPTNTSAYRGEQLLAQVEEILAVTGASKVNLIGHSQGAPTARYVAGVRPDLVASVTSVGGVNKGSQVADLLTGDTPPDTVGRDVVQGIGKALFGLANLLSGSPLDPARAQIALRDLTTRSSVAFNARFPGGVPKSACGEGAYVENGVRYYSWSGTAQVTNLLNAADAPMAFLSKAFRGEANDGLVGRCSSHLGQVIRDDYAMNHADEINQLLGLVNLFEVSPVTLYREQANRLKLAGL